MNFKIISAIVTVVLIAGIGVLDDFHGMRQRYKVLLCALSATPLVYAYWLESIVRFPFLRAVDIGYFYILLIYLGVMGATNGTNMLAGFNGLEVSLGIVGLSFLILISILIGRLEIIYVAIPMLGALFAFLYFNWYPAKIFPGDSGTLMIGAVLAVAAVIGKVEMIGVIIIIPHLIDFFMKAKVKFQGRGLFGDAKINSNGTLSPAPYPSLAHVILESARLTEKQLVIRLILIEIVVGVIATVLAVSIF